MNEQTSKEMYPGCRCPVGRCGIHPGATTCSLRQPSATDVASRLTETKLPSSPAGEMASGQHKWNRDGERCELCGDKDWMGGPCSGVKAVPEPLGAISGPKGSGGAAPECCFCGAKPPYHWASCAYLGGVAPQPKSAAPIAPAAQEQSVAVFNLLTSSLQSKVIELGAAQELVQELRRGLAEAAQSLHTIAEQSGRKDMELRHMDQVRGYANSRANVADAALARAERKEGEAKHV